MNFNEALGILVSRHKLNEEREVLESVEDSPFFTWEKIAERLEKLGVPGVEKPDKLQFCDDPEEGEITFESDGITYVAWVYKRDGEWAFSICVPYCFSAPVTAIPSDLDALTYGYKSAHSKLKQAEMDDAVDKKKAAKMASVPRAAPVTNHFRGLASAISMRVHPTHFELTISDLGLGRALSWSIEVDDTLFKLFDAIEGGATWFNGSRILGASKTSSTFSLIATGPAAPDDDAHLVCVSYDVENKDAENVLRRFRCIAKYYLDLHTWAKEYAANFGVTVEVALNELVFRDSLDE